MAILQKTQLVLGASNNGGDSDALQLFQTSTKVFVHFAGAGTLTPKEGTDLARLIDFKVPDGNDYLTTLTGSITFVVTGPGLLAFGCADIDDAITIDIEEALV